MAQNIRRKLAEALDGKGWSVDKLRDRIRVEAGLRISRASLHRKVYGYVKRKGEKRGKRTYQALSVDEYRAIATTLGVLTPVESEALAGLGLRAAA